MTPKGPRIKRKLFLTSSLALLAHCCRATNYCFTWSSHRSPSPWVSRPGWSWCASAPWLRLSCKAIKHCSSWSSIVFSCRQHLSSNVNQEGRRLLKKSSCQAQKPCSEENQEAHDLAMMAISQLYNFMGFLLSLTLVFTQISHNHLGASCQSFTIPR